MQTRDLHVSYGTAAVVSGVSLGLPDRAITALIGPSGCGKSTFLRALNRLHDLTPSARVRGRILLDGRDIRALATEELRRRVGMVFQRPNPFPSSIHANVAFGPSLLGVTGRSLDRVVAQSLERAALWDEVKHRLQDGAQGLSGGQQQRLCIARALACAPEVLLLDEPTSALDPAATRAVEQLMRELRRDMALVLVTHSQDQAERVADSVALFQAGRVVQVGSVADALIPNRNVNEV